MTFHAQNWTTLDRQVRDRVLAKLLARETGPVATPQVAPLTKAAPGNIFPASLEQEWFLRQQAHFGGKLAGAIAAQPLIFEKVNVDAVEAALEALQDWHPTLHTTLHPDAQGRSHVQALDPMQEVPLTVTTPPLTAMLTGAESHVRTRFEALNAEPFDPETGPLWRAELVKRGGNAALLLSFSNLIADGDAVYRLRAAFKALYDGFSSGNDPEEGMKPHAFDYHDYATWQVAQAQAGRWAKDLNWWRGHLDGGPPDYWIDGREGAGPTRLYEQVIGPETGAQLETYAKSQNTTPYAVMLTEFMSLLADMDGGRDVWVTSPSAARLVPGTEGMTGTFARQVLLRHTLPETGDPLTGVREMLAETFDHDQVPHLLVHNMLADMHPTAASPYRYVFNYRQIGRKTPADQKRDHSFRSEPQQTETMREEDVLCMVMQSGEARLIHWYLRTDRFPSPRAERVLRSFMDRLRNRFSPAG